MGTFNKARVDRSLTGWICPVCVCVLVCVSETIALSTGGMGSKSAHQGRVPFFLFYELVQRLGK